MQLTDIDAEVNEVMKGGILIDVTERAARESIVFLLEELEEMVRLIKLKGK